MLIYFLLQAITVRSDLATIEALTGDIDSALRTFHEVESIAKEKHAELYPNISVNIGNLYMQVRATFLPS